MRKITIMGLLATLVAALAIAATPALAHEFVAKPAKGVVQDKNVGNHVFETGGATVTCKAVQSKGVVQVEKSETFKDTVVYGECEAFGAPAQVSQAKYLFNANGTVTLENEVTVVAAGPKCEVKVPVAGNSNLGTVTYRSQGGRVEVEAVVTAITSTVGGTGGLCPKGTNKTSKYKGTSLAELVQGGKLEWL